MECRRCKREVAKGFKGLCFDCDQDMQARDSRRIIREHGSNRNIMKCMMASSPSSFKEIKQ